VTKDYKERKEIEAIRVLTALKGKQGLLQLVFT